MMGCVYSAHTIIGVRLNAADLYKKERRRGCKHPETKAKFCAQCGNLKWVDSDEPIFNENEEKIGEFPLIFSTNRSFVYLGHHAEANEYNDTHDRFIVLDNSPEALMDLITSIRIRLQSALSPLGLWAEDKFGLWTVLHASY